MRRVRRGEISFNYLGQFDQVIGVGKRFERARERSGQEHCPSGIRPYLIDVNAITIGGRLHVNLAYSKNIHDRSVIEALAREFVGAIRSIIEHCRSLTVKEFTPSDFKEFNWDKTKFDNIASVISKTKSLQ
jgi:non-ribosomal peptide synthase protein (TIGR01720 family)